MYRSIRAQTEEPRIEPFLLPSTIQVKQRQTITCTVIRGDPPLQIRWFKDGQLIDAQVKQKLALRTHQLEEYSSALVFDRTRAEHRGNYSCVASNQVGRDTYSQFMLVYGTHPLSSRPLTSAIRVRSNPSLVRRFAEPPRWTHEPQDQHAIVGARVWIQCEADGFPKPVISWKVLDGK
jgi:Down syndrome cell adhesion protein